MYWSAATSVGALPIRTSSGKEGLPLRGLRIRKWLGCSLARKPLMLPPTSSSTALVLLLPEPCFVAVTEVVGDDGFGNVAWFMVRGVWLFAGGGYTVVKASTTLDSGNTGGIYCSVDLSDGHPLGGYHQSGTSNRNRRRHRSLVHGQ